MRVVFRGLAAVAAVALVVSATGCGSPAGPTSGPDFSITIAGPSRVAPGETARFTATAHYPNNVVRDVTDEAEWFVSPETLGVEGDGAVSGLAAGEGSISAVLEGRVGHSSVLVLPSGTFRLVVQLFVEGPMNEPLSGATVAATNDDGTTAVVRNNGWNNVYRLYGVRNGAHLVVSNTRPYYAQTSQRVEVAADQELEVRVPRVQPPIDISGMYTVTVAASPSCAAVLPAEARVRSYSALVEASPVWRFVVRLQDGTFPAIDGGPRQGFDSSILSADTVRFHLDVAWDGPIDPGIVEFLPESGQALGIGGVAMTTVGPDGAAGTLDGEFQLLTWPQRARLATCSATDHAFVLRRK